MSLLRIVGLKKSFGNLTAVDGLSLELSAGEVFGLLGPNGAGKTTTVNMIVGLVSPDEGEVRLNGAAPTSRAARAQLGVAPQTLALYDELSGTENVAFFGRLQGLSGVRLRERTAWALDFVGLTDRARDRAGTYSGGMKRRLNLAVAVVHDPALLLLDEPTVGVDPQSRHAIFENILALQRLGRTIIYTTHYMEEAQRLCRRVGIMDRGKLLALDTVENLIRARGGRSVVTAVTADGPSRIETDDPLRELTRWQSSGSLLSFHLDRPDLQSVFLNLTGRSLRD